MSSFRKFLTFRVKDEPADSHLGRLGEITLRDGYLYYHDGVIPGGTLISGGSGGGGPTSWTSVTGKPTFASVATSGSYADLTNKPTIPTATSQLTNDSGFLTSVSWSAVTGKPSLFSGAYADLTGKPSLFSGAYADLTGKPTIPSLTGYATESYVNTAVSNVINGAAGALDTLKELADAMGNDANFASTITNSISLKANSADLATVATTGSYNDLTDTPAIPDLTGYATEAWVNEQGFGAGSGFSGSYNDLTDTPSIPTNVSDLTNDNGYITLNEVPVPTLISSGNSAPGSAVVANDTNVSINFSDGGSGKFVFNANGQLQLALGGDIVDSNGNSVLGSTGPTNEITNTDGNNTWSVSVSETGVVTMSTARGGIEFGAQPEEGAPQHLHIMRPAGDQGSTDLFFGDDYNYVKLPALYGSNSQGVEIGSSYDGGNVSVWRFDTDGKLHTPGYTLPATDGTAGQVLSTDGSGTVTWADASTDGGSTTLPGYKGFKAVYGKMYDNNDDPNGPIDKLVIYQDTVSPSVSIDESTNDDTFTVDGLTGSGVVAIIVAISNNITQTDTATLKTFAEAIIDNVLLNDGNPVQMSNADACKTKFYDNFSNFASVMPSLKTNFNFFDVNNQFQLSPAYETGKGATFYSLSYDMSTNAVSVGSFSQGAGTHETGDIFVIPGNTIQDASGNFLATPDNDVTVTVTEVIDGQINSSTVTGTLPRPQEIWPSNYINDGGNDEYDSGNYISTNLANEISYNNGNAVYESNEFGGGDYVTTYKDGIFGMFATSANISSIKTDGGSGFDGAGTGVAGSLYGDATAPTTPSTNIATWTNPNNNVWKIETYNGGAAVEYNGDDTSACWFDAANSPLGDNQFRGAIIEYHAYTNNGTIIGTIHISADYWNNGTVTHTESVSGNTSVNTCEFWYTDNNRRLYFRRTDGNSNNAMIQWTARCFYGQELDC